MDTQHASNTLAVGLNFIYQSFLLWFEYPGPLSYELNVI